MWEEEKKEGERQRNLKGREERWIGFAETGRQRVAAIARKVATATTFPAVEAVTEEEMMKGIYSVWMKKKKKKKS